MQKNPLNLGTKKAASTVSAKKEDNLYLNGSGLNLVQNLVQSRAMDYGSYSNQSSMESDVRMKSSEDQKGSSSTRVR